MSRSTLFRRERKFILSDDTAKAVRRFVQVYLPPDPFMRSAEEFGYFVGTLYLDTPQMEFYRRSVDGKKKRFKLRMRFYDDASDGTVFLEVKHRTFDTVVERCAAVSKTAAERLLAGQYLTAKDLLVPDDASSALALAEFCERCRRFDAQGSVFVSFHREAFDTPFGEQSRVTFDRRVTAQPYRAKAGLCLPGDGESVAPSIGGKALAGSIGSAGGKGSMGGKGSAGRMQSQSLSRNSKTPTPLTRIDSRISPDDGGGGFGLGSKVVMELKHNGPAPDWMRDLTKRFGLKRTSFPKYVRCAEAVFNGSLANRGESKNLDTVPPRIVPLGGDDHGLV